MRFPLIGFTQLNPTSLLHVIGPQHRSDNILSFLLILLLCARLDHPREFELPVLDEEYLIAFFVLNEDSLFLSSMVFLQQSLEPSQHEVVGKQRELR